MCPVCTDALFETEKKVVTGPVSQPSFVRLKDKGGLVLPSPNVISVCQEAEKLVRRMLKMPSHSLPKGRGLVRAIVISVLEHSRDKQLLRSLGSNMLDSTPTTNHVFFVDQVL